MGNRVRLIVSPVELAEGEIGRTRDRRVFVGLANRQAIELTGAPAAGGADLGGLSGVVKVVAGRTQGHATTSDLPEGTRLYFSDARAYAAAKSFLRAGANIALAWNDAAQTATISTGDGGGVGGENLLINGGFGLFQRQNPAAATSRADDTYGPDRWVVVTESGSVGCERIAGPATGTHAARLTQSQAAAQRLGLLQIVESASSLPACGGAVCFQARVRFSAAVNVRAAVLAWTGAADSVTSDVVRDWTSADFAAGGFFLSGNLAVIATAQQAVNGADYAEISAAGTVDAACRNLIALAWPENALAQGATFDLAQADLFRGEAPRAWSPRHPGVETALCQRYFEKSYELDTAPAGAVLNGRYDEYRNQTTGITQYGHTRLLVPKRCAPTVAVYSPGTGAANAGQDGSGYDVALNVIRVSQVAFQTYWTNAAGRWGCAYHFTADSEL